MVSSDGRTLALPSAYRSMTGVDEPPFTLFVGTAEGVLQRVLWGEEAAAEVARDGHTSLEMLRGYETCQPGIDFSVEVEDHDMVHGDPPRGALQDGPARSVLIVRDGSSVERFRATLSNQPPRFASIPRFCHTGVHDRTAGGVG
jgi:hypothetical protein